MSQESGQLVNTSSLQNFAVRKAGFFAVNHTHFLAIACPSLYVLKVNVVESAQGAVGAGVVGAALGTSVVQVMHVLRH